MNIWLITKAINAYDQEGDYIETAYDHESTREDLRKYFYSERYDPKKSPKHERNLREKFISHLLKGGGRIEWENEWYFLTCMKSGEKYKHS